MDRINDERNIFRRCMRKDAMTKIKDMVTHSFCIFENVLKLCGQRIFRTGEDLRIEISLKRHITKDLRCVSKLHSPIDTHPVHGQGADLIVHPGSAGTKINYW